MLAGLVEALRPGPMRAGAAVLLAPNEGMLSSARALKPAIEEAMNKAAGRTVRVEFALAEPLAHGHDDDGDPGHEPAPAARPRPVANPAAFAQVQSHPLIRRAMDVLGARLVDVQPMEPEPNAARENAAHD